MRIGVCGGTFDPFHYGHCEPILAVRHDLEWDRILYVPAYRQPFKADQQTSSGYHRFAMTLLGTQDFDDTLVSTIELERGAISYTVDTLEQMRGQYPHATIDWIIGDDNIAALEEWRDLDRIFELANFVVLTRLGGDAMMSSLRERRRAQIRSAAARSTSGAIVFAHNPTTPVSSTEIRRRVHAGQSIDDVVDPRVSRYIQQYGLYQGVPS